MRIFATSTPTSIATPEALEAEMEEEIAVGRALYREGLIVQAYMDPAYSSTFMILEAPSIEAAQERFEQYPQVRKGLIRFTFTELIGMPAVAQVHDADGSALPPWWPR